MSILTTIKKISILATGAVAILGMDYSQPASASLIGDTVLGELNFGTLNINFFDPANGFVPGGSGPQPFAPVVDPGIEFQFQDGISDITADFTGDTLLIQHLAEPNSSLSSWVMTFSDLDWVDEPGIIVGLELLSQEPGTDPFPGLTFDFTDDSISVNFSGGTIQQPFAANFNIQTEHESVPESSSVLAVLSISALCFGSALKKKFHL